MRKNNTKKTRTPEEIQDEIFRKMSAARRVEVGSQLWQLAKSLVGDKINYGRKRSKSSFSGYR